MEATGSTGAVVSYSISAADGVDGSVPVDCSPASGSLFPLGTTTVNCSATDLTGNPTGATFLVSVEDTTAPSITPITDISVDAYRKSGASVKYTSPATFDAVDGAGTASCSPASGSFFQMGTTEVICNAIDSHGNSSTSRFFVFVDWDGKASISQPSSSSASIVPLTSGEVIDLDCNDLFWAFGIKLSFRNLCDYQTKVNSINVPNLPGNLPDGYTFVTGLDLSILTGNQTVQNLPSGTGVQMDFPLNGGASDQFAVLSWRGTEWVQVAAQSNTDQILSITANYAGVFILVKK
jgi:hypothetical protein